MLVDAVRRGRLVDAGMVFDGVAEFLPDRISGSEAVIAAAVIDANVGLDHRDFSTT